jgi:hypothetical protein
MDSYRKVLRKPSGSADRASYQVQYQAILSRWFKKGDQYSHVECSDQSDEIGMQSYPFRAVLCLKEHEGFFLVRKSALIDPVDRSLTLVPVG